MAVFFSGKVETSEILEMLEQTLKLFQLHKKGIQCPHLAWPCPQWNLGTPSTTYVRQFLLCYWNFHCLE